MTLAAVVTLHGSGIAAAAGSTAVKPDSGTWGTALADNGRAQTVNAVVEAGGTAYLGGTFTRMLSPDGKKKVDRSRLAAVDVKSKKLAAWNPKANGAVRALALHPSGKAVYVGGDFKTIGGKKVPKLALVDLATGKVDSKFRPEVNGRVRAIAVAGDRIYVGGDFSKVGGSSRSKVAALDARTGKVLDWKPPALRPGRFIGNTGVLTPDAPAGNVYGLALPADGSRLYVGGDFTDFAGSAGLVVLDTKKGAPLAKQWEISRPIFDLTPWSGDGRTVFAAAGGAGGRIYAFDPDHPKRPKWSVKVDGDAVGVAATGSTVYLMGHYDYIVPKDSSCYRYCPNGRERRHLAAFDAATGELDPWNPSANTSTGPKAAAVGGGRLFVVGEFTKINGKHHRGYAQFEIKN